MTDSVAKLTVSVTDWVEQAASRQPTPGGGSVAALAGALGAAMGEMTLNFSLGRKANTAADEEVLADLLARMHRGRAMLLELSEEDQGAYAAWRETKDLPDTDPDKQAATLAAISVPQSIMATALGVLELAIQIVPVANPWLLSDLLVCGDLAATAVRCGSYNVEANLSNFSEDEAFEMQATANQQVREAVRRVQALHNDVRRRREPEVA